MSALNLRGETTPTRRQRGSGVRPNASRGLTRHPSQPHAANVHATKQRRPKDPTPEELDRWDEEWRDEWDRGDIDDSAAYDEENLDVADQSRDVEWLLDALDALDDGGDEDAFE